MFLLSKIPSLGPKFSMHSLCESLIAFCSVFYGGIWWNTPTMLVCSHNFGVFPLCLTHQQFFSSAMISQNNTPMSLSNIQLYNKSLQQQQPFWHQIKFILQIYFQINIPCQIHFLSMVQTMSGFNNSLQLTPSNTIDTQYL